MTPRGAIEARPAMALHLELNCGRHHASARVEVHERPDASPGPRRLALIELCGWVDPRGARRLVQAIDDLASRGVELVLLDCAQLAAFGSRLVRELVAAIERFEARAGSVVVCGLSRALRDRFRLAGCEPRLRCWPSATELLASALQPLQPSRGFAS